MGERHPAGLERNWAAWAHLGTLAGYLVPFGHLVFPLAVALAQRSDYVRYHAREAFNFQVSVSVLIFASVLVWIFVAEEIFGFSVGDRPETVMGYGWLVAGVMEGMLIFLVSLAWVVDGARQAQAGVRYRYPAALRPWKGAGVAGMPCRREVE